MVNSQQVVVLLPLMEGIKFPANVMLINKALIDISEFEVISSEDINKKLFYFPEVDPFTLNFSECGIDSLFFLMIMGFPLYVIVAHFALMIIYFILALANRFIKSRYLSKIVNYLKSYLFWKGFLRLYMELY